MSIKTRRLLFYSFVILFLILGSFLVLNSRGYHLNWRTLQWEATGGIYISSNPAKVKITLDERSIRNQAGLLQKGTLIDNLPPESYSLNVQLDGYSTWSKDIPVESGTVSVFDSIILIPDEEPQLVATSTARRVVTSGRHVALESNGEVSLNGTKVLGHEIVTLSESGSLLTRSTVTGNYYLANAFEADQNLNVSLTFNNLKDDVLGLPGALTIKKILPYPYNDRRFVLSTERAIYLLDTERSTLEQITLGPNDFYIQNQNSVAWIDGSTIKLFNLPLRTSSIALNLAKNTKATHIQNTPSGWLILDSTGKLSLYGSDKEPQLIANGVSEFKLGPNGEFAAILRTSGKMFIYEFADKTSIDIDTPSFVNEFAWFKDGAHLILLSGGNLIFTEVSRIAPLNQVILSTGVSSFSYGTNTNFVQFSTPQGIFQKKII